MTSENRSPSPAKYEQFDTYRKTTLDNGVRIVTEHVPYLQSVSAGIWVRTGSRFELPMVNGICHFIEHMLFKGTERRSAFDIAKEIDSVGGVMNAFTSKELTSFYCKVLCENLQLAVDLLADIYLNSSFPEDEIEREKQVVLQEIFQLEDSPEELIHEILGAKFWTDDPLGQPILGTEPTVAGLSRDVIVGFKNDHYAPQDTLVCAAGNLDHDRFVDLVAHEIEKLPFALSGVTRVALPDSRTEHVVVKDLEQVHVCVGTTAPSAVDDKRHAAYILNAILGGGMSSKLFQEVREKRGLAYNVYSFLSTFSDTGMFGIYAGCDPSRVEELLEVSGRETLGLASSITDEDIRTAKNQIKGNIILAMESTDSRMNRLAKGEYFFGKYISLDEIISSLEAVTADEISEVAEEMIDSGPMTIVALGPLDEKCDLGGMFRSGS
jgi:predicted Zn-dependent peptidase